MKYHDILGVTVFASEEKIESTYKERMLALEKNKELDEQLYQKKKTELTNARNSCLEYRKSSFGKKFINEAKEMKNTTFSENTLNGYCDDCCLGCCDCCLIFIVGSTVLTLACVLISEYFPTKKRREEKRLRNDREHNDRVNGKIESLQSEKNVLMSNQSKLRVDLDAEKEALATMENEKNSIVMRAFNFSSFMLFDISQSDIENSEIMSVYETRVNQAKEACERKKRILDNNISEQQTLKQMITDLKNDIR